MNRTTRALALSLGFAALAAAPLAAQHAHGQHAQQQAGHAQHQAAMAEHGGPHAPLMHRAELGLSADQVARLEAIQTTLHAAHQEACKRMHPAGNAGHDAAQRQQTHEAMRATMHRAHEEAAAVLTAEQRTRLEALHAAHHGQGAGAHAQHAAHHGQAAGAHAQHASHQAQGGSHSEHAEDCHEKCCKDGGCDEAACAECCKEMGCGEHAEAHAGHGQSSHNH